MWSDNASKMSDADAICEILLPREILEKILFYCDGQTLLSAEDVNDEWDEIVAYLDQKFHIWRRSCLEDIPKLELLQYRGQNITDWRIFYRNRTLWQDIPQNIEVISEVFEHQPKCDDIACIAVAGNFIGVACMFGKIRIYHKNGDIYKQINYYDTVNVIKSLHFITDSIGQPTYIIRNCKVMFTVHNLVPDVELDESVGHLTIETHNGIDVYKNYFCGISLQSRNFDIAQFVVQNNTLRYDIIASVQVQAIHLHSWWEMKQTRLLSENLCVLLVNNEVYLIERQKEMVGEQDQRYPNDRQFAVTQLLTMAGLGIGQHRSMPLEIWVMNEDVILSTIVAKSSDSPQVVDLYIIKACGHRITKYFLPQKVFETVITCICLHGNTLVIGTSQEFVYFYEINCSDDWESFDIADYSHRKHMGGAFGPVKSIGVVDKEGQRVFYVSSSWDKIRTITGRKKSF